MGTPELDRVELRRVRPRYEETLAVASDVTSVHTVQRAPVRHPAVRNPAAFASGGRTGAGYLDPVGIQAAPHDAPLSNNDPKDEAADVQANDGRRHVQHGQAMDAVGRLCPRAYPLIRSALPWLPVFLTKGVLLEDMRISLVTLPQDFEPLRPEAQAYFAGHRQTHLELRE
jgi:hypothetical protein